MLDLAKKTLLEPAGIGAREIERLFAALMAARIDYADLYFQYSRYESWSLEEGIVKSGSHNIEQGAGVRAVAGEKTGFAYSDEIVLPALLQAAEAARAIARSSTSHEPRITNHESRATSHGPWPCTPRWIRSPASPMTPRSNCSSASSARRGRRIRACGR